MDYKKYLEHIYSDKKLVLSYIKLTCFQYGINDYIINDDMSIDVNGCVYLNNYNINFIPLKFNYVKGGFYCEGNKLTSLYGSPRVVTEAFNCSFNILESLEYMPIKVGDEIRCSNNKLKTLRYLPNGFKGLLDCTDNKLISTRHISHNIEDLYISNNKLPNIYNRLTAEKKLLFLKYQEEYGLWTSEYQLNEYRYGIFVRELKEDLIR